MSTDRPSPRRCPGPPSPMAGPPLSRRDWLKRSGGGFGLLALADLLAKEATADSGGPSASPLAAKAGHFPAKAKRCIFLFMVGGPSHIDLFDPKPELNALHGQPLPPSFGKVVSQFVENDPI